jgi:phytoene dehydrogenase-like protein
MSEAIVVGSGPNGLACAAVLATRGVGVTVIEAAERIGGGTRSSELTLPGLLHDDCSAVHPMAAFSPVFSSLGLERHGLEWAWPEIDLSHPLDGGSAAAMLRSIDDTAAGLSPVGGKAWKRVFAGPSKAFDSLGQDVLQPLFHVPRHPLRMASFGMRAAAPVTALARALGTPEARALFGGVAAHGFAPLSRPLSSSIGMGMVCACHNVGWPVARGGSQAIADALAAVVTENGGKIETGRPVRSLAELPSADAVVLDLAPSAVADIAGERLPARVARAYRRYKHGPGAFKVDLAVEGGIPWADEASPRAGTVHVIGSFEELVAAEREVNRGRMPKRPFVLVGQQYLADPGRSRDGVHPIWTYAHVPHDYGGDATEAILDQVERFAPGLRERIVSRFVRSPVEIAAYNPNYIGGDIIAGANTVRQMLFRPRLALDPYATGIPGVYICSAATPPGGGVHGMGGYNAAKAVLRRLPDAAP